MPSFPFLLFMRLMHSSPLRPAANFWRAIELQALIERALPRLKEARSILDLGCGNGRMLDIMRPYLPQHAKIYGLDTDCDELAYAEKTGLFADVVCAGAEKMPYETGQFDVVIANSVLEHIGPIRAAIDEVSRVLKPGGLFIVTVPGPNFHECLCLKGDGLCRPYFETLANRLLHLRYWTLAQWMERFLPAHLSIIDSSEYMNRAEAIRWNRLSSLTGGLLFRLTGRRRSPFFLQKSYGLNGVEDNPPRWVQWWSKLMLAGFKEPDYAVLYGCLMMIIRREPDPYDHPLHEPEDKA